MERAETDPDNIIRYLLGMAVGALLVSILLGSIGWAEKRGKLPIVPGAATIRCDCPTSGTNEARP